MITELSGYSLARTIPDSVLLGVLNGSYKIFGGVVRNDAGQIVAHLVNAGASASSVASVFPPANLVVSGLNAFKLHRIGRDVTQLLGMVQAGMVISGLTLAISSAGFIFLNNKLSRIDNDLKAIASDVKSIKLFLESQERARLISALRSLRELSAVEDETRMAMLISSRQTLGEINERYKHLMNDTQSATSFMPTEEYFVLTAIGHSLCTAELGMLSQAAQDLEESHKLWLDSSKRFIDQEVIGNQPDRFLERKYAGEILTEEIIMLMDFGNSKSLDFSAIDELRRRRPRANFNLRRRISDDERRNISSARKLIKRDDVLRGYIDQSKYFATAGIRPSEAESFIGSLGDSQKIDDFFVFISKDENNHENPDNRNTVSTSSNQ